MVRNQLVETLVVGAALAAVLLAFSTASPRPESSKVLTGFIAPLTGPRASIGEDARAAVELALEELEQSGRSSLDIRFEDSQGDPAKGVAAFNALTNAGARAVITQNSNVSLPISPLANRLGVLQLAITTTSDRFTTPPDYVFRTNGSTLGEARLMADILSRSDGFIGIVTMRDEYPEMLRQHLLSEIELRGGVVANDEVFLPSETDFRALILRLTRGGAQKVLCLGYQTQCGLFVRQLRESGGAPALLLVNTPVNNREFFSVAGSAAEGVVATYPAPDPNSPVAARFRAKTGRELNFFSANAYDAIMILAAASERCMASTSSACLARALGSIGEVHGASGTKRFDSNGDMADTYQVLQARGGVFDLLTPEEAAEVGRS